MSQCPQMVKEWDISPFSDQKEHRKQDINFFLLP